VDSDPAGGDSGLGMISLADGNAVDGVAI